MATSTFNVTEFNTIYTMLDDKSVNISTKSDQIISLCDQLSQLIRSEDSNLSSSYLKVGETIGTAKSKIISLLTQLESEMKNYESRTLMNEEDTDTELREIDSKLDNIASIFNDIAGRNA